MFFKNITIIDEDFNIKANMDVVVSDFTGKIIWVDSHGKMDSNQYDSKLLGRTYSGEGKVLMPGFINAHGHSPMTLLRGYGENMALQDWLQKKIFPFEEKLYSDAIYWGTILAMAESLQFGITSTTDMYFFCEDMIRAIKEAKCKNNISRGIVNFADEDIFQLDSFKEYVDLYEKYHNADDGKIKVDTCIHAEYTSGPKTVEQIARYNEVLGARVHIHLSETKKEHEECIAKYGLTPTAYFDKFGLFDQPTTAAHCVWLSSDDMNILRAREVSVAVNPFSNLKLASGVCNVPELLKRGINVAIGTDGVASNNSLNFIEEIKLFATLPKMFFNNPTAITPKEAIYSATRGGAISQGRADCGLIKEDFKADLIVLDIDKPHMTPCHDLLTNIVYSASGSDIVLTMVDGEVLYEDGKWKTIDIEEVRYNVDKIANSIRESL